MKPEMEGTGKQPEKGRKRRRAPNKVFGAAQAMRTRWRLQERLPETKKACLSAILFAENCEVTHDQLCELLKYAVLGKSSVPKHSWCQLFHHNHLNNLNNVVVFVLQGMSQLHFYRFYLEFGFLRKAFRYKFRLPPPSNFLDDIIGLKKKQTTGDLSKALEGSLSSAGSKASINLQNDPIIQKYGCKKVGLTRCLLTKEEMKTFHFPLQGFPDCENFILTKCHGPITDNSPLFGLHCEMCLTSKGRELMHITLVAEGGCCVMDELVKPENKILDYLTSFSGITKKILNPVTTKLRDVQRQLKGLLPPDAVLVGHSLDLDLRALKMIHPYVIDTSLLYVRKQGRRFKLKFLAKAILGKNIQQCPDRLGHDATEDARTTLELAQYFLKYGPKKIAELNLEALASHQELQAADQELRNTAEVVQPPNTSILECLDSMGQKLLFLTRETDSSQLSSSRNCQTIKCLSNKEILEQARVETPLFPFSIVQFSFDPFSPVLTEEMNKRMRVKWAEISTVYAGPFSKNCNLGALKRLFRSFGPVRSITLVLETHQPHLCIQYEVLEAAQLAIESMESILVEGTCIKVRRPVTELTLDCDTLVNELEQESENRGTIYLYGVGETFKEQLLQQSNLFPGLEAVILPKDLNNGKQKKYCFLKFKTFGIAQRALNILTGKEWKLKGRQALTPRHLHTWLRGLPPESRQPTELSVIPPPSEQELLQH
ncbi:PREDICTED: putative RNA exonuclease NEF-sp isoform X2 [Galeopterus variegatus]|uniref:RNA exonuclease NEF-sp isoform X2 n=1 Tax=Galeopterus variegatus TaxID=482537 RepID=A0ABM0QTC3_GALVR|nr:PREDICTED: putative RNA exonuclease NEF-sp isoform X2 [Galeopterus variegatus]